MFVVNLPQHSRGLFLISNHEKVTAKTEKTRLRYPPYKSGDLVHVKRDQDFCWRDAWVKERVGNGEIKHNGRVEVFPQYEVVYSQAEELKAVAESVVVPGYDMRENFWREIILEKLGKDDTKPHFVTYQDEDKLFSRTISIYDAYEKVRPKEKAKSKPKKRKRTKKKEVKKKRPKKKSKIHFKGRRHRHRW